VEAQIAISQTNQTTITVLAEARIAISQTNQITITVLVEARTAKNPIKHTVLVEAQTVINLHLGLALSLQAQDHRLTLKEDEKYSFKI
jgi:hypothetical protein